MKPTKKQNHIRKSAGCSSSVVISESIQVETETIFVQRLEQIEVHAQLSALIFTTFCLSAKHACLPDGKVSPQVCTFAKVAETQ